MQSKYLRSRLSHNPLADLDYTSISLSRDDETMREGEEIRKDSKQRFN